MNLSTKHITKVDWTLQLRTRIRWIWIWMSYNCTKAYKNNGDTKAREVQELYRTKLLTLSGIQAKICLPPSRPSLTSYALETRGALRMIRVSVFFKWLIPQGGGLGSPYTAQRVQREPLDQTDLRNGVDATLGWWRNILEDGGKWAPRGTD
jgi:hypothetical protein